MSNQGYEMPEIDIDVSGVRAWGGDSGPKLPAGDYTFDVVHAEPSPSKEGKPCVEVTFKVADEGEHNGVELKKKYSLSPKALGRIANLMIACGARLDKIRLSELIGARIIAKIGHVPGQAEVNSQGEVVPSDKFFCEISNEQAVAAPEPVAAPPPAARKAAASAAQVQTQPASKNGSVARRA